MGGISSLEIGSRSLTYKDPSWGIPKVDCNGVKEVIEVLSSVDVVPPVFSGTFFMIYGIVSSSFLFSVSDSFV
jgi:hypothetical protein